MSQDRFQNPSRFEEETSFAKSGQKYPIIILGRINSNIIIKELEKIFKIYESKGNEWIDYEENPYRFSVSIYFKLNNNEASYLGKGIFDIKVQQFLVKNAISYIIKKDKASTLDITAADLLDPKKYNQEICFVEDSGSTNDNTKSTGLYTMELPEININTTEETKPYGEVDLSDILPNPKLSWEAGD